MNGLRSPSGLSESLGHAVAVVLRRVQSFAYADAPSLRRLATRSMFPYPRDLINLFNHHAILEQLSQLQQQKAAQRTIYRSIIV